MPKITKETLKQLKEYANSLPSMEDTKNPIYRLVFGWQILEDKKSQNVDQKGNPIKPNKKYNFLEGYKNVNHLKNIKKIFVKYGWEGVKKYRENILEKLAEPKNKD